MYKNAEDLIERLRPNSDIEATKALTEFFATARFGLPKDQFNLQYVDGKDDGGIDFFHVEDDTFFIIQSKFSAKPHHVDEASIQHELKKIVNTIASENPNKRANDFVNAVRRNLQEGGLVEIILTTTNKVQGSSVSVAQNELDRIRKERNWKMELDFVAFDKDALQRMIYDVAHGYIPYTGKKTLRIKGRFIDSPGDVTGVYSIVFTARVTDILRWFDKSTDVRKFLQKNIREYQGDNRINKDIGRSYSGTPDWFWYKHNGVILFADSISKSPDGSVLTLRNPQVVNGGQTLMAVFAAYDKGGRKDSTAEVLVRAYRLPYEEAETYKKSIDIIKALNSQNPIRPSDLHSTDPRQVMIEALLKEMGYKYWRKRAKEAKSGRYSITMRNLALYYYVCRKKAPHEGVIGEVEEIFDEVQKYDDVFPEDAINREPLSMNHITISYLTVWRITEVLGKFVSDLPKYMNELSSYTWFYVLSDIYGKLLDWRASSFSMPGWRNWKDFLESEEFENGLWPHARRAFGVATGIVPTKEEPRKFFKKKDATQRFSSRLGSARNFNTAMTRAFNKYRENQEGD